MKQRTKWVDLWATMPQLVEPDNLPPAPFIGPSRVFDNVTIRQTVKVNLKSDVLQLRLSNEFGETPLRISSVTVAISASGSGGSSIDLGSLETATFSGKLGIAIAPGGLGVTDDLRLSVKPGDIVSISIYLAQGQDGNAITGHPGSRTTSWLGFGDQTRSEVIKGEELDHWYYISALMGQTNGLSFCIVGDSLTDGRGSTHNRNDRWPDQLWTRMQAEPTTSSISPVNLAAGGNRILAHGLGPCAWSRIARDVLSHPTVGYVMVFEGVNDIGTAEPTEEGQEAVYHELIAAYDQIINQVHSFGLPIFGATIAPFGVEVNDGQPYSHPLRERTRQRVNEWISGSKFDYVVDFASAVEDPKRPGYLLEEYDSGDLLHFNPDGFLRLAEVFDLGVFDRF